MWKRIKESATPIQQHGVCMGSDVSFTMRSGAKWRPENEFGSFRD